MEVHIGIPVMSIRREREKSGKLLFYYFCEDSLVFWLLNGPDGHSEFVFEWMRNIFPTLDLMVKDSKKKPCPRNGMRSSPRQCNLFNINLRY